MLFIRRTVDEKFHVKIPHRKGTDEFQSALWWKAFGRKGWMHHIVVSTLQNIHIDGTNISHEEKSPENNIKSISHIKIISRAVEMCEVPKPKNKQSKTCDFDAPKKFMNGLNIRRVNIVEIPFLLTMRWGPLRWTESCTRRQHFTNCCGIVYTEALEFDWKWERCQSNTKYTVAIVWVCEYKNYKAIAGCLSSNTSLAHRIDIFNLKWKMPFRESSIDQLCGCRCRFHSNKLAVCRALNRWFGS